jgi:hypothetical protein
MASCPCSTTCLSSKAKGNCCGGLGGRYGRRYGNGGAGSGMGAGASPGRWKSVLPVARPMGVCLWMIPGADAAKSGMLEHARGSSNSTLKRVHHCIPPKSQLGLRWLARLRRSCGRFCSTVETALANMAVMRIKRLSSSLVPTKANTASMCPACQLAVSSLSKWLILHDASMPQQNMSHCSGRTPNQPTPRRHPGTRNHE